MEHQSKHNKTTYIRDKLENEKEALIEKQRIVGYEINSINAGLIIEKNKKNLKNNGDQNAHLTFLTKRK